MNNRIKSWLFEAPAILLLLSGFIMSIYAAITKQYGVSWGASIIFLIILVLFFIGKVYEVKKDF